MYNSFQLAKKYVRYYFTASNGKGHGIHSPFVYDFIKNVLNRRVSTAESQKIEELRTTLAADHTMIEVDDFGAGSFNGRSAKRTKSSITRNAGKSRKYGQLLYRIVHHYKPAVIVELGTSFGFSTSYMAAANTDAIVFTLEGSPEIATQAKKNFQALGLNNIKIIAGRFEENLTTVLQDAGQPGLVFIDGNHREAPTLAYFNMLTKHIDSSGILIFDDIHWSAEMESAWAVIKEHPEVTMTIDLFFIGLVFFKKDFRITQHFIIRF